MSLLQTIADECERKRPLAGVIELRKFLHLTRSLSRFWVTFAAAFTKR
jgi:hypothetical protein